MSGISSSVGMISGMDHQSLVSQLMAVEARPRDQILKRMAGIDAQKTAYLDISARVSALLANVQLLSRRSTFTATSATSSDSSVLTATSSNGASPGSYQFSVQSLASTHQLVSRGYTSRAAALSPGTVTIESAQARVNRATSLSELNGFTGVQRGSFKITSAAGNTATIDISAASTLSDVVDEINDTSIGVSARVRGDTLVLEDTSGGTGTLQVSEVGDHRTAADLGFDTGNRYDTDGDGVITGNNLMYVTPTTSLAALNDGLGVRRSLAGGDFEITVGADTVHVDLDDVIKEDTRLDRLNYGQGVNLGTVRITSRDGTMTTVDLTGLTTVGEVRDTLEGAFGDDRLTVSLAGSGLTITDNADVDDEDAGTLTIEDLSGSTAQDLGLTADANGATLKGNDVLHVETVADVLAAINAASDNDDGSGNPLVQASLASDGQGFVLESTTAASLTLTAGTDMHALADLGFVDGEAGTSLSGRRIVGGPGTTLLKTLNGGAGVGSGTIRIEANSTAIDVNMTDVETLADAIDRINDAAADAGLGIVAGYDKTGTRISIGHDGGGSGAITISDLDGDFAASIGLAGNATTLSSSNLQRQYISENTLLSDLNAGRGVNLGQLKITMTNGTSKWVNLDVGGIDTVGDVLREIENAAPGLTARINDTGDGLLIVDSSEGDGSFRIEDDDGTVASDLNIAGTAEEGAASIDGSFEYQLEIASGDTLASFAKRVSEETALAQATLLNDGTDVAPYRLSLSSKASGLNGELIIDEGDTGLGVTTLTEARDARLLFGGNAGTGVLLTSSDNTFRDVVDGMDITVSGVSDQPATVTVARNLKEMTTLLEDIVADYNAAIDRISQAGSFDPETEEAGPLLGEVTLRTAENRLYRMFTRYQSGTDTSFNRLADLGISQGDGGKLVFDKETFTSAFESDPEGVLEFFTDEDDGVAVRLKDELEALTGTDGLFEQRTGTLEDRKELYQDRVDRMNDLLDRKEARLLRQFQAMESMLAELQTQQSALADLASSASMGMSLPSG